MKALSLWQPWASLMAAGLKTIETRSWPTAYRGPLAIHAAKRPLSGAEKAQLYLWICRGFLPSDWLNADLPFGAIIAFVDLTACKITERIMLEISAIEETFGNFAAGRWAWITRDCQPLARPVPWRGAQGLFEIPDSIISGASGRTA